MKIHDNFMKKGYSIIELLVVMAIIGLLFGLGIEGLIRFRSTVEVEESGRQMVTLLNLIKNSAKNDVRRPSTTADFRGYRYIFSTTNDRYLQACTGINSATWNCTFDDVAQSNLVNTDLPIIIISNNAFPSLPVCSSVYFEVLTGDVLIGTTGSTTPVQGKCYLAYRDSASRYVNYFLVDGVTDTFASVSTIGELTQKANR